MKVDELTVEVPFMRVRRGLQVTFQKPGERDEPMGRPPRLALCLAKAHVLARGIEAFGPGYSQILAKKFGVSQPRVAQLHALVYLAPDLQEAVLLARAEASRVNFHALLRIARVPLWQDQRRIWASHIREGRPAKASRSGGR
ncbi:hypothetical protein [Geothrix sp. PMB-07]|uniref:hypothetical protein n=1 Tax=Geothrix sp. PMB-07 TaxID=3068640 RepID=UPI00274158D0|nr:hypothetical protein [Geothrix sp. PMB-07]WLT30901.1 hypothetical protein Q9293_14370 [Geothrix sp. PMB-07]